jgi:hypothetical protein
LTILNYELTILNYESVIPNIESLVRTGGKTNRNCPAGFVGTNPRPQLYEVRLHPRDSA